MNTSKIKLIFNCAKWTPTVQEWNLAGSFIQSEEQRKIAGFYFKDDAKLALIARLLIRFAISCCTNLSWSEINLTRTLKGKPVLVNKDVSLQFNASHDGHYAAVIADSTCNVGIDIMQLSRQPGNDLNHFFTIMSSKFTDNEWSTIFNYSSPDDQLRCFYRHWCLKESYVKAIGDGITYPLRDLDFHITSELSSSPIDIYNTTLVANQIHLSSWNFEETIIDDHCIAVARESGQHSPSEIIKFKELSFKDIRECAIKLCREDEVDDKFLQSYTNPYKLLAV